MDDVLIPDYSDDPSDFLVSFPDIKAKTTDTLYQGGKIDKSPKGSVDEPIRHLVDLINQHPSFSTLSSCSGRISLFQPWKRARNNINEQVLVENEGDGDESSETQIFSEIPVSHKATGTPFSGKGRGGWILVSHEVIEHSQLLTIFQNNKQEQESEEDNLENGVLTFKVEPMLLHVAAATHARGRQLLALALELGFRESGLVIPSKNSNNRVTVAIRGMSLSLCVPLAFQGALKPSEEYLCALVDQSNQRLERNQAKLQRLFEGVQQTLFRPAGTDSHRATPKWKCNPLADLNLWGHAAVVVPPTGSCLSSLDMDVLVFGGYGHGPDSTTEKEGGKPHCKRVGDVYCIERRGEKWGDEWRKIQSKAPESQNSFRMESLGVDVKPVQYTAREGSAVMSLHNVGNQSTSNIVCIWGGRKSPQLVLNDFILYDHSGSKHPFLTPTDVRGEPPEARWGHTLTRWSLDHGDHPRRRIGLMLGGRNTRTAINSAHILCLVRDDPDNGTAHFLWETVIFPSNRPQPCLPFHHAAILIPAADSITIFVFGGQYDPCNLLEAFSSGDMAASEQTKNPGKNGHMISAFTLRPHVSDGCLAQHCDLSISPNLDADFGIGSAVTMLDGWTNVVETGQTTRTSTTILLTGGVSPESRDFQGVSDQSSSVLRFLKLSRLSMSGNEWMVQPSSIQIPFDNGEFIKSLNESAMVHHRALVVPSSHPNGAEVLVLGGGVQGFAFGPCFSRCFQLQVFATERKPQEGASPRASGSRGNIIDRANAAVTRHSSDAKADIADVVFVRKQNAKTVKTELEELSLLDKRFRMTPVTGMEDGKEIAIPVTDIEKLMSRLFEISWASLVEGSGQQEMPFSTARYAKGARK